MPTWSTSTDWDAAQSETGVHHEQPAATDWAAADVVEKGYPTTDEGGSALEAYWPMDEDSGTTVNDVTGNGHDGTATSGLTANATGVLGTTAFQFPGTSGEVVNLGTFSAIEGVGALTISAWVLMDTTSGNNSDDQKAIYGYGDDFSNTIWLSHRGPGHASPNDFSFRVETGGDRAMAEFGDYTATGTWFHVAGVFNGGGTPVAELYVDGSSVASDTNNTSTEPSATPSTSTTTDHALGDLLFRDDWEWPGKIEDVRVYTRALSATEISDLYQAAI